MFGYKNTTCRTAILVSVLALTGGVALAQQDGQGPRDGERPGRRHMDGEGRQRGERGDRGERGERRERGERGERGRRGDRGPEAMHRRMFGDMDLSEDQKTQIHDAMKKHGDERKAWHEAHQEEFQALREKMRAARQSEDKDAAQAVRDEIKALMESAPKPDSTHDEIRAVLNDEQKAVFDERVAKMRERMDQWREGRGEGPHGRRGPGGEGQGMGPDGDGPPRDGRGARGGRLFGNLNLSDDQKASLRETMQSDQTREEKMAAVRELLDDDQKAQLDENLEKMRKFREENRGERGERGERRRRGPRGGGDGERPGRDRQPDGGDEQLDL